MPVSLIVAYDQNMGIGYQNKLPWHLPADLAYFKRITENNVIVMGRKCYESIGKPLSNRINVILTRQKDYKAEGCLIYNSIPSLLNNININEEVFVIGGSNIYRQFFPYADYLYITKIYHTFKVDTYFPKYSIKDWDLVSFVKGKVDSKNKYMHDFLVFTRK